MKKALLFAAILIAALAVAIFAKRNDTPSIAFAKATRANVANTLSTNGKVEPLEYVDVRVETRGLVRRVLVHQGDAVQAGQLLAELTQPGAAEDLAAAEARAAQAQAEFETLKGGGRSADIAELEGNLNRLRAQRDVAQRNLEASERLLQANAATR